MGGGGCLEPEGGLVGEENSFVSVSAASRLQCRSVHTECSECDRDRHTHSTRGCRVLF